MSKDIKKRWVMAKLVVVYPLPVPADWNQEDIDFYLGESSSCASNRVTELPEVLTTAATTCWCDHVEEEYVREVTPEDLVKFGIKEELTNDG